MVQFLSLVAVASAECRLRRDVVPSQPSRYTCGNVDYNALKMDPTDNVANVWLKMLVSRQIYEPKKAMKCSGHELNVFAEMIREQMEKAFAQYITPVDIAPCLKSAYKIERMFPTMTGGINGLINRIVNALSSEPKEICGTDNENVLKWLFASAKLSKGEQQFDCKSNQAMFVYLMYAEIFANQSIAGMADGDRNNYLTGLLPRLESTTQATGLEMVFQLNMALQTLMQKQPEKPHSVWTGFAGWLAGLKEHFEAKDPETDSDTSDWFEELKEHFAR